MRKDGMPAVVGTIFLGLAAAAAAAVVGAACAAPANGPCAQITAACQQAGFSPGGATSGTGIQVDCIVPIMQGTAQRPKATKPLPQVDPQLIAACKTRNPNFGQRQGRPGTAGAPPAAGGSPPANAPTPPADTGQTPSNPSAPPAAGTQPQ